MGISIKFIYIVPWKVIQKCMAFLFLIKIPENNPMVENVTNKDIMNKRKIDEK